MSVDLSTPLANPAEWEFYCEALRSFATVTARSWYGAREQAAALLGCAKEQLVCVVNPCLGDSTGEVKPLV